MQSLIQEIKGLGQTQSRNQPASHFWGCFYYCFVVEKLQEDFFFSQLSDGQNQLKALEAHLSCTSFRSQSLWVTMRWWLTCVPAEGTHWAGPVWSTHIQVGWRVPFNLCPSGTQGQTSFSEMKHVSPHLWGKGDYSEKANLNADWIMEQVFTHPDGWGIDGWVLSWPVPPAKPTPMDTGVMGRHSALCGLLA